MIIFMVRHGQTAGNRDKHYVGTLDEPLCREGVLSVKAKGRYPAIKKVYTSSLLRTQETANLLFPSAELIPVTDFREQYFGDYQGKSFSEILNDPSCSGHIRNNYPDSYPNGETSAQVMTRVCRAFEKVLTYEAIAEAQTCVFVVHCGTIISVMMRYAMEKRGSYYDWNDIGNVCGRKFEINAALPPSEWLIKEHEIIEDLSCIQLAYFC